MARLIVLALLACLVLVPAAWAGEILYAADGGGGHLANLYVMDPTTGAIVLTVGPIGFAVTGLAIDPVTGVLYGSTGQHSPNAPNSLIRIDRTTGQGTLVGSYGIGNQTMADLTFTSDGALYGWLQPADSCLHTINQTTGQATPVGACSRVGTFGSGLAADASNTIYLAGRGDNGELMTVNRTTGQVTTVATLTGTTGASVSALAFSSAGVLFGSVLDEGASRTANLVTIDTITGQLTVVGPSVPGLDAIVFASPARAQAPDYRLVQMIVIPDRPLASYDISFVDPRTNTYYLADRSNARVDIFDAKNNRWVGSVGGFAGFTGNDDTSGPDGVAADGNRLYAGNGDSTLKVIDLDSLTIINSVNTGGSRRVGKMALDSAGHRLLVVNDADTPPFLTLISTKKGNPILFGPATVLGATARLGQPVWDPSTKRFYISVPELNGNAAHSGVAVFDPKTGTVESVFDIGPCGPSGLALGPHQHLLLGCAQEPSVVIDAKAGTIVANIPEVGGSDEVWFNPGDNRYYLAARNNPGGPFLGVVDADANLFIQNVPTSTNSHSVAANPRTNDVYVPLTAGQTSPCPHGCIGVFADFSAD